MMILYLALTLGMTDAAYVLSPTEMLIPWEVSPADAVFEKDGSDDYANLLNRTSGQVTPDGRILLSNRYKVLDYNINGELNRVIDVGPPKLIRAQTFDHVARIYAISIWDPDATDGRPLSYVSFYHSDGSLHDQQAKAFQLDGKDVEVVQIRYLEGDEYLVNVWAADFAKLAAPKTLVRARLVKEDGAYNLQAISNAFDPQWGTRRRLDNNFTERWAAFLPEAKMCVVAHSMDLELGVYAYQDSIAGKTNRTYSFDTIERALDLDLNFWQDHAQRPKKLIKQAQKAGLQLDADETRTRWRFHFSRISGLSRLENGLLIMGYTSPNPSHRFYRDQTNLPTEQLVTKSGGDAPYVLTLKGLTLAPDNPSSLKLVAGGEQLSGGIYLGTYGNSAYCLMEQPMDAKASTYELVRYEFWDDLPH